MFKSKKLLIYCLFIIYCLTFVLNTVQASWVSDILGGELIPDPCRSKGECSLTDFVLMAIHIFRLMLGVLGSLALLFFIYGGSLMILSRGNTETIQKGKNTLTQAFIGIMIVLGSWLIVNIVIAALTGEKDFTKVLLFGHSWWEIK